MNLSDSDDDPFTFNANDNFIQDEINSNIKNNISTEQHYKAFTNIINNTSNKLSEFNNFELNYNWNTYSPQEPISLHYEPMETQTGVFDIIKSDNIFINKVIQVFSILSCETHNILSGGSNSHDNDVLYPLVIYGETQDDDDEDNDKLEDGEAENQISKMLPSLSDLLEKIQKLLSIAINILNQIIALYNSTSKSYVDSFKNISLFKPFDNLGRILAFFSSIDTVVQENQNLVNHWRLYRLMFQKCKSDPLKFGFTEDQAIKLEKNIKRIDGSFMNGKLLNISLKHIIENTGELKSNGILISAVNNKEFSNHLKNYLTYKLEKLNSDIGSVTETNEKKQLLEFLGVFAYYCRIFDTLVDKSLYKNVWSIQKKITNINVISHVNFNIEEFLTSVKTFPDKGVYLDPKDVGTQNITNFNNFLSTFVTSVINLKMQVMTWITRMESEVLEEKTENILNMINTRIKLIINGVILAHQIKIAITYCLNSHLDEGLDLKTQYIGSICTCIELLKVIEMQFKKSEGTISISMSMMLRNICESIKSLIDPIEKKLSSGKIDNFKSDILQTIKILNFNLSASPSKLRMIVMDLCIDIIKTKKLLNDSELENFTFSYWRLEIMQKLSSEIKTVCNTSFFYWFKDVIPECFNYIYSNEKEFKRLFFFCCGLNDTIQPLLHVRYLEDNTVVVKKFKEFVYNNLNDYIILRLAKEIENELRIQVHSIIITNLQISNPCKDDVKEFNNFLKIRNLLLFEKVIDLKAHVEDYLNKTYYEMTTLNLNDWKTYQQMRVFAHSKFGLELHNVYLPSQTLDQGIDILFILRNMVSFVSQFNYNLDSQIFIEVTKESYNITIIGVQQILNSLCTHGIGIVNTIVNKTYQFLVQRIKTITQFIMDEYIKSSLMLEKRYWTDYKEKNNNMYPFSNAENVCNDIKNLIKTKDEMTLIDKLRIFITQIGNACAFIRTIRTALKEFNSQNLKFFNHDPSHFVKLTKNSVFEDDYFKKTNSRFNESLSLLDLNRDSGINYLAMLVNSLENVFNNTAVPDLDLFYFLIPAVTINFVETLIISKDKINKKNIKDAYFCDDGFVLGLAFLLKVFNQDSKFDSLHWFQSVMDKFEKDARFTKSSKGKQHYGKDDELMQQNMSLRKIDTYRTEFEILYFTFNSAVILFNAY